MVSISNLIKFLIIFTLFLSCQMQARTIDDVDFDDSLFDLYPNQEEQFYHPLMRRASLRYHPHILYKKASLKPLLVQNGKFTFSNREND